MFVWSHEDQRATVAHVVLMEDNRNVYRFCDRSERKGTTWL